MGSMLLIVPASGEEAYEHFRRTIERAWSVDELLALGVDLPSEVVEKLRSVGRFRIWGSLPSVRGFVRVWPHIDQGWVVAFYRKGRIVCYGVIFAKVHSPELAEKLWGKNAEDKTWEYVYFIRDLRCCEPGIPWDDVRRELGYSEGFVPRGHQPVDSERLKSIVEKYGDVLRFFDSLAKEPGACTNFSSEEEVVRDLSQRYNPYFIQSLKRLRPDEFLEVIGRVAARLAVNSEKALAKEEVIGLVSKIFEEAGLEERVKYVANSQYPLFLNDLRRLGLLSAGDAAQDEWQGNVPANVTPLSLRAADAVKACRRLCRGRVDDVYCFRVGGALVVASIVTGIAPAGSQPLSELLEEIARGSDAESLAERLTAELGIKKIDSLRKILDDMRSLIELAYSLLHDAVDKGCLPQLYVPLGIFHLGVIGGSIGSQG
jgi:hypothetical protein